jgi:hypothetical protein
VPSAHSSAAGPISAAAPDGPQSATHSAYFGILGAVTHPGVYELPADCTFGQLVRHAGGITHQAVGDARVFRGARLAQQLFVTTSDSAILYPDDLIVIESSETQLSVTQPRKQSSPAVFDASAVPAPDARKVQIGFLNLIDRPVVMQMPREQASLARIVELLQLSPELRERIHIVDPSRKDLRPSAEPDAAGLLRSGTVLIFPKHRVRLASLSLLPDPIAPPHSRPKNDSPSARSVAPACDAVGQQSAFVPTAQSPGTQLSPPDTAARKSAFPRPRSAFRNVALNEWERQRLVEEKSHARSYFPFYVLGGMAALAMLLTIGSMGSRWIHRVGVRDQNPTAGIIPPVPTLSTPTGANRPLRIDANQPQTRLGIDLAVFERARARHTPTAGPDPTPKAA